MKNRIEKEINRTLDCLDDGIDIRISSGFADNITDRISNIKISRGIGYRNNIYYSLAIILLVILNLTALLTNFKKQRQVENIQNNDISVLSNEYGISQSDFNL